MRKILVTAAVVQRNGCYLVTKRTGAVHLEGYWEFPGGKCHEGESLEAGLRREMREELGADVRVGEEILAVEHAYETRRIELHFMACELMSEPTPRLGQEMRWVAADELHTLQFPPADDELISLLQRKA